MSRMNRFPRRLAGVPFLLMVSLALSCGGGSSDLAGGGTGGTGISTGAVSGFGSVVVNGVHFRTDGDVALGFLTEKLLNGANRSGRMDRDVFAVGMIVTVRHGSGDNNASVIEYRDNLRGPIAGTTSGTDNIVVILGQTVVVEDAGVFASLRRDDVVEVSGYVDNAGRIRAAYILPIPPPNPPPVQEFEVKGYVSNLSSNTFRLGPLPGNIAATLTVSYGATAVSGLPEGMADGMYVQVTTDRAPTGGVMVAKRIEKIAARTEFPENVSADLEGLVTTPWDGQGSDLSFALEGKKVRWNDRTEFVGGTRDDLRRANGKVRAMGTETGGILSAARIGFR